LGDGYSENELGKYLWFGIAVPQDRAAAVELFKKAAAHDIQDAKNNLYWSERQMGGR
jgi:TPR repeat protein